MKAMLESWFSYKYFGVILLCVIAFLALLFIVLFALAIKDAKKNEKIKKEIEKPQENNEVEEIALIKEENIKEENIKEQEKEKSKPIIEEPVEKEETNEFEATLFDIDSEIPLEESVNPLDEIVDIQKEQDDLQSLAMSLAKGYQSEKMKKEEPKIEEIKEPKKEIRLDSIKIPSFDDIPKPQPVRVVSEEPVIDAKDSHSYRNKRSLDDLVGEEYKLK